MASKQAFEQIENTPLAERARQAILDAILSKRFEERLPAEDELAQLLNVSRTTIRTALHSLELDGIITRRRAVGTTINKHVGPSMLALQRLVGFDWLLKEKGHDVRVEVSWDRRLPPPELAAVFEVQPDEDCLVTEKIYFADGEPAIYLRDLVPWRELKAEPGDSVPPSLFEFSKRYCERPIDHAVVEIVPMAQHDHEATKLAVEPGEPFIRLHERHYSSEGEAVAFSVIDADGRFIRFEVFRRG